MGEGGAGNRVRRQLDHHHLGCRVDVDHLAVYARCFVRTIGVVQNPPLVVVAVARAIIHTRGLEFLSVTANAKVVDHRLVEHSLTIQSQQVAF